MTEPKITCPTCDGTGLIARSMVHSGLIIAKARTQSGLTQSELAALVGCSRASIANIENGRHELPAKMVRPISAALSIKVMDLLP